MIIDDLDLVCVSSFPAETDPPLIIDPDAVLTDAISSQLLQSVSWRDTEILKGFRRIQQSKFAKRRSLDIRSHLPNRVPVEEPLRLPIAKALDHALA